MKFGDRFKVYILFFSPSLFFLKLGVEYHFRCKKINIYGPECIEYTYHFLKFALFV